MNPEADAFWWAAAFSQSVDGILLSDRKGTILRANPAWLALFGGADSDLRGRSLTELGSAETAGAFARFLALAIEHGAHRGELPRFAADGERRSTSTTVTVLSGDAADESTLLWICRDSTSEARIAESLQALGKRFRAVVQSATDSIIVINDASEILLWNATAESTFGRTEQTVLGQRLTVLFHETSRAAVDAWIEPLLRGTGRAGITVESVAVGADGREFPVEISFSAFVSGRRRFASAIVRDISARRAAEDELRRALAQAQESDRLKSAFLAGVSHELRSPLNVLLGTVEILAAHWRATGHDAQDAAAATLKRASKRLVGTMDRILDYARLSTTDVVARPERVRLAEILDAEIAEASGAAEEKGLSLVVEPMEDGSAVFTDRHCLGRAIANLLDNAVKFTEQGGVTVRVRASADRGASIEIEDTGIGIAPVFRARLFDPFTQEESGDDRRYEGQGLGLAVTRRSIELCDASLEVESEKGRGSLFRIRFPARPSVRRDASAPLLIVDATGDASVWLERIGRRFPWRVVARSEDAWEAAQATDAEPAGLLIDLLGDPQSLALVRRLRRHPLLWDLPIVGWYFESVAGAAARAIGAGCDEVFTPPLEWSELAARLGRRLARA